MPRSKSRENEARRTIDTKIQRLLEETGKISIPQIEGICDAMMDIFDLSISNYYRLRSYFIAKYLDTIKNQGSK